MPQPSFLYKILDEAPEVPVPAKLPTTELDQTDGFIHLSTAKQIPTTANLFFAAVTKLWILKLRPLDLDGEIEYPADLPECAHVHDSRGGLGSNNVDDVIEVNRSEHEHWTAVPALRELPY